MCERNLTVRNLRHTLSGDLFVMGLSHKVCK